jgi:replication-associated recombination protein RarA
MPPKTILNAPTRLMREQEYGAGYRYDHDEREGFSGQHYFPEGWSAKASTARPSAASSAS